MPLLVERTVAGLVVASCIAIVARRRNALSDSGAIAAAIVGTAAVAAGWNWGTLLVAYFVASSALSRFRSAEKQARTQGIVEKGDCRDATQVLANGGIFAASAVLTLVASHALAPMMTFAGLGALAAAAADTWGTEIGTLYGRRPRSLISWQVVEPGTSGGVSVAGTAAVFAGAAFVAGVATALQVTGSLAIIAVAGVSGAVADSLLGAMMQERRWCETCKQSTEQHVHACGAPTTRRGGLAWMDNDVVNLLATIVGAVVASLLASF